MDSIRTAYTGPTDRPRLYCTTFQVGDERPVTGVEQAAATSTTSHESKRVAPLDGRTLFLRRSLRRGRPRGKITPPVCIVTRRGYYTHTAATSDPQSLDATLNVIYLPGKPLDQFSDDSDDGSLALRANGARSERRCIDAGKCAGTGSLDPPNHSGQEMQWQINARVEAAH